MQTVLFSRRQRPRAGMVLIADIPKDAFQVTPTGQVATSFPDCATVFTLNEKRAARIVPGHRPLIAFAGSHRRFAK